MSVKTFKEFREEIGLGEKLVVGDEIIIKSISFAETRYGTVAVFETDKGKRYSGATAIVDVARKITPEYLPMSARVEETVSASGRTYQILA